MLVAWSWNYIFDLVSIYYSYDSLVSYLLRLYGFYYVVFCYYCFLAQSLQLY